MAGENARFAVLQMAGVEADIGAYPVTIVNPFTRFKTDVLIRSMCYNFLIVKRPSRVPLCDCFPNLRPNPRKAAT